MSEPLIHGHIGVLSAVELCDLAGVTYRQLHHWTTKEYVFPEGSSKPGSGHQHRYNVDEARIAILAAGLMRIGFMRPAKAFWLAREMWT